MRTTMDRSNPWAWGHQILWGSQGGKRKERGWAKKHQGKVREISKYVQVFRSLFFYNERFNTWRLMDCQGVFCKARSKLASKGWVQKAPGGGQQALTQVCWAKLWGLFGGVFTPLHLHTDFAIPFLVKLFLRNTLTSQWSWSLTYPSLKCCPPTPDAVGGCFKTWCI